MHMYMYLCDSEKRHELGSRAANFAHYGSLRGRCRLLPRTDRLHLHGQGQPLCKHPIMLQLWRHRTRHTCLLLAQMSWSRWRMKKLLRKNWAEPKRTPACQVPTFIFFFFFFLLISANAVLLNWSQCSSNYRSNLLISIAILCRCGPRCLRKRHWSVARHSRLVFLPAS